MFWTDEIWSWMEYRSRCYLTTATVGWWSLISQRTECVATCCLSTLVINWSIVLEEYLLTRVASLITFQKLNNSSLSLNAGVRLEISDMSIIKSPPLNKQKLLIGTWSRVLHVSRKFLIFSLFSHQHVRAVCLQKYTDPFRLHLIMNITDVRVCLPRFSSLPTYYFPYKGYSRF